MKEKDAQLYVGAYLAAYAITMFKYPDWSPASIGKRAEEHADFVVKKANEIETRVKKEKQP